MSFSPGELQDIHIQVRHHNLPVRKHYLNFVLTLPILNYTLGRTSKTVSFTVII